MTPRSPTGVPTAILTTLLIALLCAPVVSYLITGLQSLTLFVLWIGGAALLGLLSGYTTGASEQTGISGEFLKFIGGGVLVPLVGGVTMLVLQPQTTIERSTYVGTQLVEKVTETKLSSSVAQFYPIGVLGSFFVAYGAFATVGILLGIAHRQGGISIKVR